MTDRFWSKVARDPETECWEWTACTRRGYATYWHNGRNVGAHRYAYEHLIGPVPDGLELDHLCSNKRCVNPAHLEPVTAQVNTLRGNRMIARFANATSCIHGHPFDEENTYCRLTGGRMCRTCVRLRRRDRYARTGR